MSRLSIPSVKGSCGRADEGCVGCVIMCGDRTMRISTDYGTNCAMNGRHYSYEDSREKVS